MIECLAATAANIEGKKKEGVGNSDMKEGKEGREAGFDLAKVVRAMISWDEFHST